MSCISFLRGVDRVGESLGPVARGLNRMVSESGLDSRFNQDSRFKNGLFDEASIHFMSAPWHNIHLHQD